MSDPSPLRPRERDVAVRRLRSIRTGATVAGLASFAAPASARVARSAVSDERTWGR